MYTLKYVKQKWTERKEETGSSAVTIGYFSTPLAEIGKEIEDSDYTMKQLDRTIIYRTSHPTVAKYPFFSMAYGTFCAIEHMLVYRTNVNKFRRLKSYKVCSLTILELNSKPIIEGNLENLYIVGN